MARGRLGQSLPKGRRGLAAVGGLRSGGLRRFGGRAHGRRGRRADRRGGGEAQEGEVRPQRTGLPVDATEPRPADAGDAHSLGRLV